MTVTGQMGPELPSILPSDSTKLGWTGLDGDFPIMSIFKVLFGRYWTLLDMCMVAMGGVELGCNSLNYCS